MSLLYTSIISIKNNASFFLATSIEISKRSILSEPCAQVGVLAPLFSLNPTISTQIDITFDPASVWLFPR